MTKIAEEIKRKLKDMTEKESVNMIATVKSVDEDNSVCEVEMDGLIYTEVQLKSIMKSSSKGIKVLPAVDSIVIVTRIGASNELFVSMYSEIDKLIFEIDDMSLAMTKDGFVFNGGDNKGMVLMPAVVDRFNLLEKKINDLITVIGGWTPALGDGGTALKAALGAWLSVPLVETADSDIENTQIKQ